VGGRGDQRHTREALAQRRAERRTSKRRRRVAAAAFALLGAAGGYSAVSLGGGADHADERRHKPARRASTAPGTASAAPSAPLRKIRISAVGDIVLAPFDVASPFGAVRPHLAGDVVLGNLEGTLTRSGVSKCRKRSPTCFAFRSPPEAAAVLADAGFTVVNLANNHSYDFGAQGQADTAEALADAGLETTGRIGEIARQRIRGARVAVVGFAPYGTAPSLLDLAAAKALVEKADRRAELVVVTMHAGAEGSHAQHVKPGVEFYAGENRGDVMAFAHAAIDAGADLVVGHGPHILRGLEWYRGRLIAYSLGNFSDRGGRLTRGAVADVTAVLRIRLRSNGAWIAGRLVPVRIGGDGIPRSDPASEAVEMVERLSRQDFGRRAARLGPDGRIRAARES
jgi:hypothetical protein